MPLDLGSASATLELSVDKWVSNANRAGDAIENIQRRSESAGTGIGG